MDNDYSMPNEGGLIPPLDPGMIINTPNLSQMVLCAVEAVALGMDPREASDLIAHHLFDLFSNRIDAYPLNVLINRAQAELGYRN